MAMNKQQRKDALRRLELYLSNAINQNRQDLFLKAYDEVSELLGDHGILILEKKPAFPAAPETATS